MKNLIFASLVVFYLIFSSTTTQATTSVADVEAQYEFMRQNSNKIVMSNRTILQNIPSEEELEKISVKKLAQTIGILKNLLSANLDYMETLLEVIDTMHDVILRGKKQ